MFIFRVRQTQNRATDSAVRGGVQAEKHRTAMEYSEMIRLNINSSTYKILLFMVVQNRPLLDSNHFPFLINTSEATFRLPTKLDY